MPRKAISPRRLVENDDDLADNQRSEQRLGDVKDTDTKRAPARADGGDTHTMLEPPPASQPRTGTMRESPYRHSYGAPLDAADIPTVTIVPPCTGPADGVAALTCTSAYT